MSDQPKSKSQERREAIQLEGQQEYNFPHLGVTIQAISIEEAEKKAVVIEKQQQSNTPATEQPALSEEEING